MNEKKRKLLIYAHYYVPDTASTGQILKELAEGLLDIFDITVICTVPSYLGIIETKYKKRKYYRENINGVDILRIRVPEFSKSNKISRIKNILSYFIGALAATRKAGKFQYILAVSQPPILGGLLGVWGKWMNPHSSFLYQIQDFNPEQIMSVQYSSNSLLLKVLMCLDKFSCKRADKVITVGRELAETLYNRFRRKPGKMPEVAVINNWVDEKEIYPLESCNENVMAFRKKYGLENKFVIMYSGNLGHYYDLMNLLKVIEKFKPGTRTPDRREVAFAFVGAGGLLEPMKSYCSTCHMTNVVFIPYQKKTDLIYSLNAGDVHWCVNAKGIKGVSCPSKYYGIAAVGKPVIGVLEEGTEIRYIIEETEGGLCCEPGDYSKIEENLRWYIENCDGLYGSEELRSMGVRSHKYLLSHLTKDVSIKRYGEEILCS